MQSRRPDDREPLDQLERLYTQQSKWEPLIGVLDRAAELTEDEGEKLDLIKRVASLWQDALQRPEKAAESYERVLDIDLTDEVASAALTQLYTAAEDWESLAGLYVDCHEVVKDEWSASTCSSALFEEKLERSDKAYLVALRAVFIARRRGAPSGGRASGCRGR